MTPSRFDKVPSIRGAASRAIALLAFVLLSSIANRAMAQSFGAFTLEISEKEMKLEHPTDMMWDKWLMWDTSSQREDERNMPYLQLTNDATSTAPITQLHLTIGDTRFNFAPVEGGQYALLGSTPGHTLTSSTLGDLGNELVVNIGNGGLAPGEKIRFKINLNVDPSFEGAYSGLFGTSDPDYRTILFDMNGKNVYDPGQPVNVSSADNAMAYTVFDPAVGANFQTNPVPFADEPVPAGNFFNNFLRQYGEMDPVLIFDLEGSTTPGGTIPEPNSGALALLGLMGGLFTRLRSRRRAIAA
jgi:hypothetical protein